MRYRGLPRRGRRSILRPGPGSELAGIHVGSGVSESLGGSTQKDHRGVVASGCEELSDASLRAIHGYLAATEPERAHGDVSQDSSGPNGLY